MFSKKKPNDDYNEIIGITTTSKLTFNLPGSFLVPLFRALLCYLLVAGSILGYVTAFNIQFNYVLINISFLAISVFISFVHEIKSNFFKNSIYIIVLVVFALIISNVSTYVNSGYHAILNLTYASLENYYNIPAFVFYEEIIENSYTTITVFLMFLGIFEILLFNMWIAERINVLTVFLITFGPLFIPLMIEAFPDPFYIFCLLSAYISIIIIRFSLHINNHPEKRRNYFTFKKSSYFYNKSKGFAYGVSGIAYSLSVITGMIYSLIIILVISLTIPSYIYQRNYVESNLKKDVNEGMKYFVTFGLSGLFNQYNSTGGLNDGRLGGISSVRPDNQTDLIVTYVPTSYETIYLKGFTGTTYEDRKWLNVQELSNFQDVTFSSFLNISIDNMLAPEFNNLAASNTPLLRMDVTNVDGSPNYYYYPYYTNTNDILPYYNDVLLPSFFFYNTTRTYNYIPYNIGQGIVFSTDANENINNADTTLELSNLGLPDEKLTETELLKYLQVPQSTREEIIEYLYNNDFNVDLISQETLNTELSSPFDVYSVNSNLTGNRLDKLLIDIEKEFHQNFVYSLNPGITPDSDDFVGSFLNDSKKGFCAHFATSAALILRTLGVPARYVEGYVLTADELYTATPVKGDLSQYIDSSMVEDYSSIYTVEITDEKAHAWVEYYDPIFGWKVFEATTASFDSNVPDSLWATLMNLFQSSETDEDAALNLNNDFSITNNAIMNCLIAALLVFALLIIFFLLNFIFFKYVKQYRSYHRVFYNTNIRNYYRLIAARVEKRYPEFSYLISTQLQLDFIKKNYKLSKRLTGYHFDTLAKLIEQAQFSSQQVTYSEYQLSMKTLKLIRHSMYFNNFTLK